MKNGVAMTKEEKEAMKKRVILDEKIKDTKLSLMRLHAAKLGIEQSLIHLEIERELS